MADRHPRGYAVRVDDHVRDYPLEREGKVFLAEGHPHRALLAVARSEFVADLRDPNRPHSHLSDFVAVGVFGDGDAVDRPRLSAPCEDRRIDHFLLLHGAGTDEAARFLDLPYQRLLALQPGPRLGEAVRVHLAPIEAQVLSGLRCSDLAFDVIQGREVLLGLVGPEEGAPEHAPLDRGLVDDDAVLLVVPREAGHRDDRVRPVRHGLQRDVPRRPGLGQRPLRIVVKVLSGLEAQVGVRGDEPHRLLAHRRLERVLRRLVVVRVGDRRSAHPQNHRRVDLQMRVFFCPRVQQIVSPHRDQQVLLLLDVHVFDEALVDQSLKTTILSQSLRIQSRSIILYDKKRSHESPRVSENSDLFVEIVDADRHVLAEEAPTSQFSHVLCEI